MGMCDKGQFDLGGVICSANDEAGASFLDAMQKIYQERARAHALWVEKIKKIGVVGCHPDDRWVDHEKCFIVLCYPEIWGEVKVGALFMLGDFDKWRLVLLRRFECYRFILDPTIPHQGKWYYEEIRTWAAEGFCYV